METKIKLLDKEFIIESKLSKTGVKFPFTDKNDYTLHNKFTIKVSRVIDGKKITKRFSFYDNYENFQKGIKDLDEKSLLFAFRCILEDGLAGTYEFNDFCSEYGYSNDSIKALRIYNECKKTLSKLLDLGIFESEITDLLNELSKMGIE
jgi:hypothetical protein